MTDQKTVGIAATDALDWAVLETADHEWNGRESRSAACLGIVIGILSTSMGLTFNGALLHAQVAIARFTQSGGEENLMRTKSKALH